MPEKYADPAVYAALKDVYQTYASTQELHKPLEVPVNEAQGAAMVQYSLRQSIIDQVSTARKECDPRAAAAQVFQFGRDIAVLRSSASSAQAT